jgi:hypothetical protein
MKLNKIIYVVPLAVLILAAGSGCRKSQFNINKNINNPTDSSVTYDVVLPAALNATGAIAAFGGAPGGGGTVTNWGVLQNWMSYWSRSGTYAPNVTEETYQITTSFGTGVWNSCYDNNYDLQIIQQKAAVAGAGFYEGIARILKAHNYQILVDVYGNVPYTQALKGSSNPTPKYDKGIDIYNALFAEIDAGLNLINTSVVTEDNTNKDIWKNDIMFGNPATGIIDDVPAMRIKWNQFGNTLKLRMLIHAYAVAGINKATLIANINANGNGYLTADASVNPGYSGNDKPNSFFTQYITGTDGTASTSNVYYAANDWGVEYYAWNGDQRRSQSRTYTGGSLKGVPYGTPPIAVYASGSVAKIGPGVYKSATARQVIISAAESYFLQAEAKQRSTVFTGFIGNGGASASSLLTTAINESFNYLGATGAATYISNNATYPDVDYAGVPQGIGLPAGGLFTILSQKWFAMNGVNPLETWTDWRRVPYTDVATKLLSGANASTTNFVYGDGGGYTGTLTSPGTGPFRSITPGILAGDNIPVRFLYPQSEYNYNTANVNGEGVITRTSRIFWDLN